LHFPKRNKRGFLVTFSGLDGSGKSTQIEHLMKCLAARGSSTRLVVFWDDVVVLSRYRESFVHRVYKSQRGIGTPGKPVERRDKNVRRWYLNLVRHVLYLADALHLAWVVARSRRSAEVLIFDRYIYDEWANLPLENALTRWYVRLVDAIVPRPEVAFLLDAEPAAARTRKPEYPVEFLQQCRSSYKKLAVLVGTMTLIPPLPLAKTKQQVESLFWIMTSHHRPRTTPEVQKLDRTTAA
jgi:thymidylate kinase